MAWNLDESVNLMEGRLPIEECVKVMRAERAERQNVYVKWVAEGKMTEARKERGLLEIDSVIDFLEAVQAIDDCGKRLLQLANNHRKANHETQKP